MTATTPHFLQSAARRAGAITVGGALLFFMTMSIVEAVIIVSIMTMIPGPPGYDAATMQASAAVERCMSDEYMQLRNARAKQ